MKKAVRLKKYQSFSELRAGESRGADYEIRFRSGDSGIAVLAPHGGDIEPGTTEIANAVAGKEHGFYSFEGLKRKGNSRLHITSTCFDEPLGLELATTAEKVLAIHGCKGDSPIIFLGGRDTVMKEALRACLAEAGFPVAETPRFPGKNERNLCNRGRNREGVQLEISLALRMSLFSGLERSERSKGVTKQFHTLVSSVREALLTPVSRQNDSPNSLIP